MRQCGLHYGLPKRYIYRLRVFKYMKLKNYDPQGIMDTRFTLVKSSRIYTGQYTFQIVVLNDDNILGEHN